MHFAPSFPELTLLFVLAVTTGFSYLRGGSHRQMMVVTCLCVGLAILFSPADLLSTFLLGMAFAAVFLLGQRFRSAPAPLSS